LTFRYSKAFITIATVNLPSLVEFYSQLLQQQPNPYFPNIYAEFSLIGLQISIFTPKSTHRKEFSFSQQGSLSICLEVDNLEETIAYLRTIDYPRQPELSIASHGREIYIYDPDGNRLILHQNYPQQ
jgi:predicted enzyme related to lactoylglutathione lyase